MANTSRLVELSMVPPLAKEVASQIDGAIASKAAVAALVALTDSSGGTASNTIPAQTDSYVEATQETTVASLAGKINEIIAALKA